MRLGACGDLIDMADGDRNFLNNIVTEFLPESTALNAVACAEVLKRLLQRIRRVCTEYAKQGSWTLLHDNAQPHTTLVVRQFLATNRVVTLDHQPPYLPVLAPAGFFLFPRLRRGTSDIQSKVTAELKVIPKELFYRSFQDL
ncbi:mariner Mos1 transposase [Trichonephila clavipes]|nr:mariner Mos1 transposase [Trichonephila clavipes]